MAELARWRGVKVSVTVNAGPTALTRKSNILCAASRNATEFFEQFLADSRADGVPSTAVIVRYDDLMEAANSAEASLVTCVDHEGSSRNLRQPTAPNSTE